MDDLDEEDACMPTLFGAEGECNDTAYLQGQLACICDFSLAMISNSKPVDALNFLTAPFPPTQPKYIQLLTGWVSQRYKTSLLDLNFMFNSVKP